MDPMGTNSYYPFFGGRSLSFQKLMRNPLALDSCCGTNKELPFSPNKRTGFLSNSCIDIYIFNKQAIYIYIYIQYIHIFALPCLFCLHHFQFFPPTFPKKNPATTHRKTPGKPCVATLKPQAVSQAMTEGAQLVPRARVAQLQVWIRQRGMIWPESWDNQWPCFAFHIHWSTPAYQTKSSEHVQLLWGNPTHLLDPFGTNNLCFHFALWRRFEMILKSWLPTSKVFHFRGNVRHPTLNDVGLCRLNSWQQINTPTGIFLQDVYIYIPRCSMYGIFIPRSIECQGCMVLQVVILVALLAIPICGSVPCSKSLPKAVFCTKWHV